MFTLSHLAAYPFLPGAREHVAPLGISLELLVEIPALRQRTEKRLRQALEHGYVLAGRNPELELLSFAAAGLVCSAVQSDFLSQTWATAEGRRVGESLQSESDDFLRQVIHHFDWSTRTAERPYEVALHFTRYLALIPSLRDAGWHLISRQLVEGFVHLTRREAETLLSVEATLWVLDRINQVSRIHVPEAAQPLIQDIGDSAARVEARVRGQRRPSRRWEPPWVPILLKGVSRGMRDEAAIRLTSYYVNVVRLQEDQILQILLEWNERNSPPIGRATDDPSNLVNYFQAKVKSARRGGYIYGPNDTLVKQLFQRTS